MKCSGKECKIGQEGFFRRDVIKVLDTVSREGGIRRINGFVTPALHGDPRFKALLPAWGVTCFQGYPRCCFRRWQKKAFEGRYNAVGTFFFSRLNCFTVFFYFVVGVLDDRELPKKISWGLLVPILRLPGGTEHINRELHRLPPPNLRVGGFALPSFPGSIFRGLTSGSDFD